MTIRFIILGPAFTMWVSGSSKTPNSRLIFISVTSAIPQDYNEKSQRTGKRISITCPLATPINKGVYMETLLNQGFSGKRRLFPLRFEYLLTHKNECRRYLIRRLFLQLPVWFCEKNLFVYPSCTSKSGISLVSIFVGNRGTTLFLYGLYEYYTTKGAKINSLLPKRCSSIWFCTAFSVSRRKQLCQSIN